MVLQEWIGFCNDCNLISPAFTMRECRGIFVRVNLDDDLYIQEDEDNSADVVVYDEFEECLCRMAVEIYPVEEPVTAEALARSLKQLLEHLIPIASKIKPKKP
eukprot:SAG31_NODE_5214_length_2671_cov_1.306376_5_plen_103_part_00